MPVRSPAAPGHERLWTAPFILLTLANMCLSAVFYLLVPTMASFATGRFDADPGQAGLAASVFFFGALAMRFVAGGFVAHFGPRRSAVITVTLAALAVATYLLVGSLAALYTVRFVHGMLFALVQTSLTSTVMTDVPPHRRGEGAGWFTAGLAIMTGLGPAIGLELLTQQGMESVLLLSVAVSVAALALVLPAVVILRRRDRAAALATNAPVEHEARTTADTPGRGARQSPESPAPATGLERFLAPQTFSLAAAAGLAAVAYSLVLSFFGTHVAEQGLHHVVGPYFLAFAGAGFLSRSLAGPLQDRRGDTFVFVPAFLSLAAGVVLTGVATQPWLLLLGGALVGGGNGTIISAGQASAINRVGAHRSGQAVSSYFLFVDAGTGLGPAALGGAAVTLGYSGLYLLGAAVALAGLVLYLLGPARTGRPAL